MPLLEGIAGIKKEESKEGGKLQFRTKTEIYLESGIIFGFKKKISSLFSQVPRNVFPILPLLSPPYLTNYIKQGSKVPKMRVRSSVPQDWVACSTEQDRHEISFTNKQFADLTEQ